MVSVPIVPRNTRWLSFPVTTSTIKCSGTLAFALELVNWRLPPSRVSRPVDFALTPSSPMNCTTLVPVAGCCATVGGAVNPTMPNRAIAAVCIERKTIAVSLTCFRQLQRAWITQRLENPPGIRGATIGCSAQKVNACVAEAGESATCPRWSERNTAVIAGTVSGEVSEDVSLCPTLRHSNSALLSDLPSKSTTCGDVTRIGFGTKGAFTHGAKRKCPTVKITALRTPTFGAIKECRSTITRRTCSAPRGELDLRE